MNSKIEPNDILVMKIEEIVGGASNLMSYYACGDGKGLYSIIASTLGTESAKKLYSDNITMQELNQCMEIWSREKENSITPKM